MALFSSLNIALTGLQTQLAALQTIGHNISNATTPGFSRQRVHIEANRPNDYVRFQIGAGANLAGIRRVFDQSLEGRLRDSAASLGSLDIRSRIFERIEGFMNALSEKDIGGQLDQLFEAIEDLTAHPEDFSARQQVLQNGQTLSESFQFLGTRLREVRSQLNDELLVLVDEINRMTDEMAQLNREVVDAENGGIDSGAANDLRDRRDLLARELSDLIDITTVETSVGELNVLTGSSFLVFGSRSFDLGTTSFVEGGVLVSTPVFSNGAGVLPITGGRLGGLVESRDGILGEVLRQLDVLANAIIDEFNRVHANGQGLVRLRDATSTNSVANAADPLAIGGSVTLVTPLNNAIVDSSLIGFPSLVGKTITLLNGQNALEQRRIQSFDPTTGTLILDAPLRVPPGVGDRYQIGSFRFPVRNGNFKLVVTNELTGVQQTFAMEVDLDKSVSGGVVTDTSLNSIITQINAASPGQVTASLTPDNRLRVQTSSDSVRFSFSEDTSGFLAAIGMNPMFDGVDAGTIKVNEALLGDPRFLAAAQSNAKGDNTNALALAALRSQAIVLGQASFEDFYQGFATSLGVDTQESRDRFEHQQLLHQQLLNQRDRVSGVNLDEEAVNMITHQRAFQANARFIATVDEVLRILMESV